MEANTKGTKRDKDRIIRISKSLWLAVTARPLFTIVPQYTDSQLHPV